MAWVDRALPSGVERTVGEHVGHCDACAALTRDFEALHRRVADWRVETPPRGLRVAVMSAAGAAEVPSSSAAAGGPRLWRRLRWPVAASIVLAGAFLVNEISVCGAPLCRAEGAGQTAQAAQSAPAAPAAAALQEFAAFDAWWQSRPRVDLGVPANGAKVTIVWFVDYECPACAATDPVYSKVIDDQVMAHFGAVSRVVRDWPWNAECNPNVAGTIQGHEASCAAAVAMHLAADRGTADALRAWLFSHQDADPSEVVAAAQRIGHIAEFDARYPAELQRLRRQLAGVRSAGVTSTPSCYVNGVRAADDQGHLLAPQFLARAVELELRRAGGR